MNTSNPIGIFMDYSIAHIMELSEIPNEIQTIESKFASKLIEEKNKGEKHLCKLAKECNAKYFKKIGETILLYSTVLLFGPTDAKADLYNMLSEDPRFFRIKAYLKETGIMTLNQRNKFMNDFFAIPVYESAELP
ncbi:hypothetical protein QWY90_10875 [Flavobacterium paronense]|uniref:Uncharacterized protein n=1 Tax=Flavobacterium paronense TaxID=1392775 RepID=A0ABV5GC61_9FLAO|nr:hypothetical protein [Flavobacterium paronense]MDN3677812.1 hypothetical protein [Flavobacterium paronense]